MRERCPVRQAPNRPDHIPRDRGVLFHDTGPTGWRRIRNLHDHKAGISEDNFGHLYSKFTHDTGDEAA
jgi:hypothetical protein